jgi:hypothetical protein
MLNQLGRLWQHRSLPKGVRPALINRDVAGAVLRRRRVVLAAGTFAMASRQARLAELPDQKVNV